MSQLALITPILKTQFCTPDARAAEMDDGLFRIFSRVAHHYLYVYGIKKM